MPVAAPTTNLLAIQQKVRRLTRSPSQQQLSDTDLQNYINTFVVYDFPEHLRTFNFRQQFTFTCNPYQDVYNTDILSFGGAANANLNPLYDFQNKYLTVHEPFYVAGFQSFYTQSPEQFYGVYPKVNSIQQQGVGDSVTTNFQGVITNLNNAIIPPNFNQQTCLTKNMVLFSSVDVNSNALALQDSPILDATTGNPTVWGVMYSPLNPPPFTLPLLLNAPYQANFPPYVQTNYINYITGQFSITFQTAPMVGFAVNSQTVPEIVSLPQAVMFYENQFTLRPIPDQPYEVNFEAYMAPTYLMETTSNPALNEYWQYIAYGAAKKIFEDRMDMDSVALILPEFKKQQALVQRRSIVQWTNERTATIYTEQVNFNAGFNGWGFGGGNF